MTPGLPSERQILSNVGREKCQRGVFMVWGRCLFIVAGLLLTAGCVTTQTDTMQTLPQVVGPPQDSYPAYCKTEFTKLREETEKQGVVAKAAAERRAPREEVCKDTTVYAAAMAKWVKYTESNKQACGISERTAAELKEVYAKTVQNRLRICGAGPVTGR